MSHAKAWQRTALLIGEQGLSRLQAASVMIVGLGGVGSFALEAIARAGVGRIILVDDDFIEESNLNRQLLALHSTIGMTKVAAAAARIRDINPDCQIEMLCLTVTAANLRDLLERKPDYVIDAIDSVAAKAALLAEMYLAGIPVLGVMGTGNKLDAASFLITDISKTHTCPLARALRRELKRRGIQKGIKVIYSPLPPMTVADSADTGGTEEKLPEAPDKVKAETGRQEPVRLKRRPPGSISFVPSVAGLLAAGEAIRYLLQKEN
ncbi:MAG: tRNA threonylcarbamoyladenosine dehydratase [Negativicutes bacterium]|nr:tRNA threonylcarbamoyladenosine dehydratase [Negativicutes bacterium]